MNLFEEEGLMTDEEAREILIRLGASSSAALLGFSLFVNHIINRTRDNRKLAHTFVDDLAKDLHQNIDNMLDGKLSEKDGVYQLKKRKEIH